MVRKNARKVRAYMQREATEHVDWDTNECSATGLAEDAAEEFNLWGPAPEYEIPEWVLKIALEVATTEEVEIQ